MTKYQVLYNLETCYNYSVTNYVKVPVFHFFEKVNNGHLKIVSANYQKWPDIAIL